MDDEFAEALLSRDLIKMNTVMKSIVILSVSSFDSAKKLNPEIERKNRPENFFHGLVTGLLICLRNRFVITSNGESGQGRYDTCVEPILREKDPYAFLFEYKVFGGNDGSLQDTALWARNQIDEKSYDAVLKAKGFDDAHIIKLGFGFRGKDVLIVD